MLPASHRLPKEQISKVLRFGRRVLAGDITFIWAQSPTHARFAFIVSTKVDKRATERNRIRRILSESVGHVIPRIANIDGVFVVHKNIANFSQPEAESLVRAALSTAKII